MLYSLLTDTTDNSSGSSEWASYLLIGIVIVLIVVMLVISTRRNKKRQQEAENLINAVRPGNKVKTIGGVCGIVVEVDDEENTFVLETGSEDSGKSYMKFDKQAIYQTDAVVESQDKKGKKSEEESAEETSEEAPAVQPAAEPFEESVVEESADSEQPEDGE